MKFSILIFCLFIIQITTYGQNIIIKGSTIDYESQWMQPGTVIYIDSVSGTITDDSGQFILKRGELNHQDTLKVRFIGMYELNFINLPTDKDTITLDSIPSNWIQQ
jgi:RecB family endonuclease NucS